MLVCKLQKINWNNKDNHVMYERLFTSLKMAQAFACIDLECDLREIGQSNKTFGKTPETFVDFTRLKWKLKGYFLVSNETTLGTFYILKEEEVG